MSKIQFQSGVTPTRRIELPCFNDPIQGKKIVGLFI